MHQDVILNLKKYKNSKYDILYLILISLNFSFHKNIWNLFE